MKEHVEACDRQSPDRSEGEKENSEESVADKSEGNEEAVNGNQQSEDSIRCEIEESTDCRTEENIECGAEENTKCEISAGDASTSKLSSELGDQSKDSKVADEQSAEAESSRHRDGELFQRTMKALSRSEMFTSFLKSKIDETRSHLLPKEKENASPKEGKKRKKSSPDDSEVPSKKKKNADGSSSSSGESSKKGASSRQPKLLEGAVLRDYQLDGLDWLMALDVSGAGGILADEMGLGKTIQVIALVSFLIEVGSAEGPFLIMGPLSTVTNWMNEFERFAPKIPVVVFYGSKDCRAGLRRELRREHTVNGMRTYPVVITSYNMPLSDTYLRNIAWRYLIVDEGHRLKNHKCKLIQELRKYRTISRLLLTGTPLQNNLTELWSLLNFILPDIIDDQAVFESWFDEEELKADGGKKIIEAERKNQVLTTLHRILKPFLLRRVKADVALNIPPKRELIVYARLTPLQNALYTYIGNRALDVMRKPTEKEVVSKRNIVRGTRRRGRPSKFGQTEEIDDGGNAGESSLSASAEVAKLLKDFFPPHEDLVTIVKDRSPFMDLRKICQHPYLVSFPATPGTTVMPVDERLVTFSGKLQVLDALLKRLHSGGHKVLIFSNFTAVLDLIQDYLHLRSYKYSRLDGTRDLADRKENIDSFNQDTDVFAFLISTRAGGLGINLVAADTVVIFDSDWNPQADLQAQDRCHRIGQTRPVVVYRLVVGGTVDEVMIEMAESKMRLDRLVINHGKFNNFRKDEDLSAQDLEELLTFKDRHKVKRSKEEVLSSADLDMLCDRKALFSENALSQDGVFKIIKEGPKKPLLMENNQEDAS